MLTGGRDRGAVAGPAAEGAVEPVEIGGDVVQAVMLAVAVDEAEIVGPAKQPVDRAGRLDVLLVREGVIAAVCVRGRDGAGPVPWQARSSIVHFTKKRYYIK